MKYSLILLTLVTLLPTILAHCCETHKIKKDYVCPNGSTTKGCCGACNVFCCACKGACTGAGPVEPSILGRDVEDTASESLQAFQQADADDSGNVTLSQYLAYMEANDNETAQVWMDYFTKHDRNQDGVLTLDEVEAVD